MVKILQNEWLDNNKTTAVFFINQVGSLFILVGNTRDMHLFHSIAWSNNKEELVIWADINGIIYDDEE